MTRLVSMTIHEIATDGLPKMEELTGRVAFIFDGSIVSGWPLEPDEFPHLYASYGWDASMGTLWEADSDVGHTRPFGGVTHWVEFGEALWEAVR